MGTWSGVDWGPEGPTWLLECVHLPAAGGLTLGVAWPQGRPGKRLHTASMQALAQGGKGIRKSICIGRETV